MTAFLYISAYVFLCLPYAFFLTGWLRLPYSLAATAVLLYGTGAAILSVHREFARDHAEDARLQGDGLLPSAVIATTLVMLVAGVGGWGYQSADWLRGNAVMLDLVNRPWPVVYETATGPLVLVYYSAFYLPAAWIGKFAGWQAANHALFVFGLAGLTLAVLWTVKVAGVYRWWVAAAFLAFSGMDVVGKLIRFAAEAATGTPYQTWSSLEWWAGFGVAAFPSNMEMMANTPNQAIPAWLITALVLNDARQHRLSKTCLFYLGVSTLWAPFFSIGLLPVVAVLILPEWPRNRGLAGLASWANVLGLLLGLTTAAYFSMRYWPYTLPVDVSNLYQERLTLTLFRAGPVFLGIYPLFVLLEFGLLHVLLYTYLRKRGTASVVDPTLWRALVVSTVALSALPWINGSWNNDIVLRASLPMLFVTAVVVLRVLDDTARPISRPLALIRRGIVIVAAVGMFNAAWIFTRQAVDTYGQRTLVAVPDPGQVLTLFELQEQRYNRIGFNFAGQLMGSTASPFAKHVMRRPTPSEPSRRRE